MNNHNSLNSLILEGEVIGEPHYLEEKGVLNFSIETTRYYHNKEGDVAFLTSQFKVVVYGYRADLPLKVGSCVRVVGRLRENKWVGLVHSEVQVVAEHIEVNITK